MDIGIPKEIRDFDQRVGLGCNTVEQLVSHGHQVFIQTGAGEGAGFTDELYINAGGTIVYSAEEVYKRSELICRVTTPSLQEIEEMQDGQIICGFAHLAAASPQRMEKLLSKKVSIFAYEMLRDEENCRVISQPMSQIAGQLLPQIAGTQLQSPFGRGLLLSGLPGLPPANVTILGAGQVGFYAARAFVGLGALVTVLDIPQRLDEIERSLHDTGRFQTMFAYPDQISMATSFSNVVIGAIHRAGERPPHIVSEEMVLNMPKGAVLIDVAIDQGGCVATSRPTTLRDPTFTKHGVIHYCVPNFTALVARTASRALSNVVRPYLLKLADDPQRLFTDPELHSALAVFKGQIVSPQVAVAHGQEPAQLEELS